jgi:hypothetical protein
VKNKIDVNLLNQKNHEKQISKQCFAKIVEFSAILLL